MMSTKLEYVLSPDGTLTVFVLHPEQGVSLWYCEASSLMFRWDWQSARKCAWHDNTMISPVALRIRWAAMYPLTAPLPWTTLRRWICRPENKAASTEEQVRRSSESLSRSFHHPEIISSSPTCSINGCICSRCNKNTAPRAIFFRVA